MTLESNTTFESIMTSDLCPQVELDEALLTKFSYLCSGDVCPMQSVIGSIAAQEVMKVSTLVQFDLLSVKRPLYFNL